MCRVQRVERPQCPVSRLAMSRYYDKLFKRMELPRSQKNSVGMACCPESVEFLSPSQARGFSGGFSGHQGVVRNVADQLVLKTVEMPTLVAAASELGRRGNQGAVRSIANQMELKTGGCRHWRRRLPSWAEGVTKAHLTSLLQREPTQGGPYILWKAHIRRQHRRHCQDRNCS